MLDCFSCWLLVEDHLDAKQDVQLLQRQFGVKSLSQGISVQGKDILEEESVNSF